MTTISENPTRHDYTVTLTFKAHTWCNKVDPDLATQINNVFRDWREGRPTFDVEMVNVGLDRIIKQALFQACQKRANEKYGNESVDRLNEKGEVVGKTSLAYLEAEKEYDKISKDYKSGRLFLDPEPKVRVLTCGEADKFRKVMNMNDEELAS